MKKRTLIVNKTRFFCFLALVLVLMTLLITAIRSLWHENLAYGMAEEPVLRSTQTMIVHAGDRVWGIAEDLAKKKKTDTREMVRLIYRLNHLGKAPLQPGQQLRIPTL